MQLPRVALQLLETPIERVSPQRFFGYFRCVTKVTTNINFRKTKSGYTLFRNIKVFLKNFLSLLKLQKFVV